MAPRLLGAESMRPTLLALVLVVATGCPGGGTCSSPLTLFPSVSARGVVSDAGVVVDVTWQPTTAPASFYASPSVAGRTRLLDAGVTGAQVFSSETTDGSVVFDLRYVEGATRTCRHVGMDDTYVLSVSVPRLSDGGVGAGTVTTDVQLGAL